MTISDHVKERPVYERLQSVVLETCKGESPGHENNILLAGPWGCGKTTLIDGLHKALATEEHEGKTLCHIIRFSPWTHVVEEDPRLAFLRLLANEVTQVNPSQTNTSHWGTATKVFAWAESVVTKGLDFYKKSGSPLPLDPATRLGAYGVILALKGLTGALSERDEEEAPLIEQQRDSTQELFNTIAKFRDVPCLLLIIDDMDRARPEQAIAFLESMYHLFLQRDNGDNKGSCRVVSVWAVNTTVLEESLYDTYRNLPNFDPGAYLEKIFGRRVSVPPLFAEGRTTPKRGKEISSSELWEQSLKTMFSYDCSSYCEKTSKELAYGLNYPVLGNLRVHARVRRDCIDYWKTISKKAAEVGVEEYIMTQGDEKLVRDARLFVLIICFRNFRDEIALYRGMWPHFINRLNLRWR